MIQKQNRLISYRMDIPKKQHVISQLKEDLGALSYAINRFENPVSLMPYLDKEPYSHLQFPTQNEVLIIDEPQ